MLIYEGLSLILFNDSVSHIKMIIKQWGREGLNSSLPAPWKRIRRIEVKVHSFLTSVLDERKVSNLTWRKNPVVLTD
jgi:hypothetical protein